MSVTLHPITLLMIILNKLIEFDMSVLEYMVQESEILKPMLFILFVGFAFLLLLKVLKGGS